MQQYFLNLKLSTFAARLVCGISVQFLCASLINCIRFYNQAKMVPGAIVVRIWTRHYEKKIIACPVIVTMQTHALFCDLAATLDHLFYGNTSIVINNVAQFLFFSVLTWHSCLLLLS